MVSVRARLLATMFSGVAAWYLTGVSMQETGLPPLDWVLQFAPAAVLFTAFAVGGVANAVNIIDGFNGLAAGAVAIMLGAISLIALQVGDTALSTVCLIVAMGALAFGAVNWPFGLLFMGDGGAYLLGFLLAWVAVLLPMRHAEVNAWATILVCAYPVLEVGFSVRRRRKREGHHPGQPDRLHLHHLIHRRIVCLAFPRLSPGLKNGLTSPICWLLVALPGGAALLFAQNTHGTCSAVFLGSNSVRRDLHPANAVSLVLSGRNDAQSVRSDRLTSQHPAHPRKPGARRARTDLRAADQDRRPAAISATTAR